MLKKIFLLLIFLMLTMIIYCHPHLFIDPSVKPLIENSNLVGLKIVWQWDQWWSEEVIFECDLDGNGHLDDKEIQLVYDGFFSALKFYDYFTRIFINDKEKKITEITDFFAEIIDNNIVVYRFVIPLSLDIGSSLNLRVIFNDDTIFTAFENKIILINNDNYTFRNIQFNRHGFYGVEAEFKLILQQ